MLWAGKRQISVKAGKWSVKNQELAEMQRGIEH
jgi:hypothetical protein